MAKSCIARDSVTMPPSVREWRSRGSRWRIRGERVSSPGWKCSVGSKSSTTPVKCRLAFSKGIWRRPWAGSTMWSCLESTRSKTT